MVKCKIIGNITEIPFTDDVYNTFKSNTLKEGCHINLINNSNLKYILKDSKIISYEFLTGIGNRVIRYCFMCYLLNNRIYSFLQKTILNILGSIGYTCIRFLSQIGNFFIFCIYSFFWAIRPPWYLKQIHSQIIDIGYFSLPVVGLTTFFSGMVLALQTSIGFSEFNSESTVARVVLTSITRELGPLFQLLWQVK